MNTRKPDGNASNTQVSNFIRDKYVLKKWIDEDEEDPALLYWNGPTKKKSKKTKKKKAKKVESEDEESEEEEVKPKKKTKAPAVAKAAPAPKTQVRAAPQAQRSVGKKPAEDLIGFGDDQDDGFGDLMGANVPNNNLIGDDFGDF